MYKKKKVDKRKKYSDEQVQQMSILMQEGYTTREIAKKMGIEYNATFTGYISALKTGYNRKSITNPFKIENVMRTPSCELGSYDYNYICHLLEKNYSITEIAEKLDVECTKAFCTTVCDILSGKSWVNVSKNYNFKNRAKCIRNVKQVERIHSICKLMEDGFSAKQIAEKLDIEYTNSLATTVSEIRKGKIWESVSKNYSIDKTPKVTKLTEPEIHVLCKGIDAGLKYRELAKLLNVEYNKSFTGVVSRIKNGHSYTNISKDYNFIKNKK